MKNNKICQFIKNSIDIHFHIGPEVIPRKFNASDLVSKEGGKINGLVLKNHFYPTVPFIEQIKNKAELNLYGSIVLNNFVGGLNPEAIYSMSLLTKKPFFVWFPTINAKNFLENSDFEIAPEWVKNKNFKGRPAKVIKPVLIEKYGVNSVLNAIKKTNAILATGHISWQESVYVVNQAIQKGIKKIVITHPIYQRINMPLDVQIKIARKGCFIEQCFSMFSIDKIPLKKIVEQINKVGAEQTILSSDLGQAYSPLASEGLYKFAVLLKKSGISEEDLRIMLVDNPKKLLSE